MMTPIQSPDTMIESQNCLFVYVGFVNIMTKKGKLLISHRSTIYPCYLPVLGDLTGAGRIRLTQCKNSNFIIMSNFFLFFLLS